jgi:hypothetical protein
MKKQFLLILISLFWASFAFGQLQGIVIVNNTDPVYPSLSAAIDSLNHQGVGDGGVTIMVAPGNPQTAPAGGYVITASGDQDNPIIIDGNGNTVTAFSPQDSGKINDAIFKIIGGDWITITGFMMMENPANTITTASSNNMTEFGVALFYATPDDGPQNCSIIGNTITLGALYQNAFGIYANSRHTATSMTSGADITSLDGAFNNLQILNNTISNVNMGVVLVGSATGNYMARNIVVDGNNITYGYTGSFSGYYSVSGSVNGILLNSIVNVTVNNNKLTSDNTVTAGTLRGIYHYVSGTGAALPTSFAIVNNFNNNNIFLKRNAVSASIYGIHLDNYNDSVTNYVIADTIRGLGSAAAYTSAVYGIYHQGAAKNQYFKKNIFQINTNTSGAVYVINANNTIKPNGIQMLDSNRVDYLDKTVAGGTVYFYYSNGSSDSTVNKYFTNNVIDNVTLTGATTFYGFSDADGGASSAAKKYYNNNIIKNISGGTSVVYGFYATYGKVIDIHNNIIQQLTNGGNINCIYAGNSYTLEMKIYNNKIQNISTTSGIINGIYSAANATGAIVNIYNDTITGLNSIGSVYGIQIYDGITTNVYNNLLYDLNSSGTTGTVYGIYAYGGTTNNIYNNFISELYAPSSSGTNQIIGINLYNGNTQNVYYNTIYLDAASSGTDFGTSGIYAYTSPTTIKLQNNIVVNNSIPAGTGLTVALRRASTSLTQYDNSSNNNLFYADTPGASNLIYYDGTDSYETLSDFQTLVAPRESASITNMPPFINTSIAPYDLHINTTVPTGVESGGIAVVGIDTDYDGDLRFGATGYTGEGTAPDIGADEFEGTPSYTCTTPNPGNTVASNNPACYGETINLSLENPTPGTGVSYQWMESIDGSLYTDIDGATNSTYSFVFTESKYYQCEVTCLNDPNAVSSTPVFIDFANKILSTTPDTLCGAGQATLSATATTGADIVWYDVPTGGTLLYTGSPFTTPLISDTTSYYVAAETSSPGSTTVGTGTSTTYYLPFNGLYDYSYGAMLYTADELNIRGPITKIQFHVGNSPSSYETNDQRIYMSEVPYTEFADNNLIDTSTLTKVKGPFSYTWDGGGWKEFVLDIPFDYSGNNSLLIVWVNNDGSYASGYPTFSYTTKTNTGLYKYQDASYPSIPGTGTITSDRPNIIVDGQKVCSSPRVEVVAIVNPSTPITITDNKTICNNAVDSIEVLTGASEYETFTWSPATNLFTDVACTTPYVSGSSASKVYFKNNTAGTYEYICLAENTGTGCATTDTVEITVLPATASIIAAPEEICISGSTTLSISPSDGYGDATFQWASSTDGTSFTDIAGANGLSYTTPDITASTYYKWTATVSGNSCLSDTVFIKVNNPQILSTIPGSHCGPGTVELSATASVGSTINWYDVATGGQPLATGDTFITPVLTSTTTYYVEASVSGNPPITIGDGQLTSTGAQSPFYHLWGGKKSQYLIRASELTAAGFTAGNIGKLSFEVTSVGTVPFTDFNLSIGSTASTELTTTLLTGLQPVYTDAAYLPVVGENAINFVTPFMWDGTSNIVIEFCWSNNNSGSSSNSAHVKYDNTTFNSTSYIQRDNQLASALCALTTGATTATTRPKFTLGQVPCVSARQEVIATITTPPAIITSVTPNDTICDGDEITLNVTSGNANYEYTWTYDSQIYSGASFTDSPSTSTQYIINANDPISGCVNLDTINVTVYPSPSISVSANPISITCGESVQLNATGVGYIPTIIVSENFNGTTHSFTAINNSTGGSPADAAWTLRPDGYYYSYTTFHSNDNSQFIMSNSDDQGSGGTTNTELISPEFSTVGLDSLVLDFYHFYRHYSGGSAVVDLYDGTQWVNLKTYTATVGSSSSFVYETINLSAYAGLSNVKIRFKYQASYGYYWAIDNVTITGYTPEAISWTSNPAGFTSTIANPVATPITNTTYIATLSNNFGCTDKDSIAITVNPITVSINADETQICVGSSTNLTASGAEDYTWSDGTNTYTGASIVVSPTITTTYSVTGTTTLGCMNTAVIEITVNSYINKVEDVSICSGESYTWYGNVYNTAGTYYDTIPATMGCDTAAQLNLTILPLPTITANADESIVCPGAPVVLTAGGGVSYEWNTTQTGSIITVNPTTATTYTVTGTDANGCENTASISISVNPLPTIQIIADDNSICDGASTTLTATGGVSYVWSTTQTGSIITVNPTTATTYTVTGTDANGCENTATVAISVYPKYEFIDNDTICQGDVYSWHGNTYSVAGTYYDSLQTINGCDSVYVLHLTVNPLPNITASANPSIVCSGSPATLTAGGGVSYEWSTTQTGGIITVNPTSTTTYTVTGTDANGCENTASVSISVNPLPTVSASATPSDLCIGASTTISASGAITYEWDNGETTESFTVAPDETTTYIVTGTDANGCENTAEITVIVNPLPQIMITADNTTLCSGQSVTLTASSDVTGTTYLWNNGLTDAIITQYPTDNTTYTVTATTPAGCESTADIDITVNPSPTVDLGEDIVQCGGTVTLDAGAGFSSYQWNPPLSNNQTMIVSMSGTYYVTVTNEFDCSATDDIVVTISNVTVSLAETENGLEATIDPIVSGSYTWYTCDNEEIPGVTEAIYTNPTIGECYYVVFTDEYNCEFISNQVTVTSIADNVLSNAKVYPVPATDKVIVELINNNGAEVYLYDMLGQLVNSYKMDDSKLTIDVSKLSGNFLLKVITPDNTVNNFRIVITK